MKKLRDLHDSINNLEGEEIPYNIIKDYINPLKIWLERTIILQSKSKKTQGLIQADAGIALHQIWPGFCEKQIYNMYERMTGKKSTMSYNKTRKWLRDNFKE